MTLESSSEITNPGSGGFDSTGLSAIKTTKVDSFSDEEESDNKKFLLRPLQKMIIKLF